MITRLYSIFDRAAASFGGPIVAINDQIMKRSLVEFLVEDQGRSNLSRYPDEFDVHWIGSMDTDTGMVTGGQPTHVCRLSELLPRKEV